MADLIQNVSNLSPEDLQMLANMPIAKPPDGIQSNFINPPTREALQMWTTTSILVVALLFYANRLYVKTSLMKRWTWDDATLFVAVALAVGQYSLMTDAVKQGLVGRHLWDVSIVQMLRPELAPVAYSIAVIAPFALLFLKLTFFILYLHLFGRIRWAKISSWCGICFVVLSNGAIGIYTFVIANPHEYTSWTENGTSIGVPTGILNLIADVAIFIIPFAAIIPLQISHAKRIGALLIFLTGGSAIICSILNIYYRHRLQHSSDTMWESVLGSMFSLYELFLGITCACLPAAAYGFRQKGSIYHRVLHPSYYITSKQRNSTLFPPTPRQRPEAADAESLNSRSRIRCTTCVEISRSEPESDTDGKRRNSSITEECEDYHSHKTMELKVLEPVYLPPSDARQHAV